MRISGKEIIFWTKCVVIAGACTYAAYWKALLAGLPLADMRTASGVIAQLSGTMLGFVLAALAVLTTIDGSRLIRNMVRTGHFQLLLRRMVVCIAAFGVATFVGTGMIFLPVLKEAHCYVLLALGFFAMELLADVCWKFWMVLNNLHPSP